MTGRGPRRSTVATPARVRRAARSTRVLALLVAATVAPAVASAQSQGDGYLFGAPRGTLSVRGGWALPTANSDIFAFTTKQLTLDKSDFGSPAVELELAIRLGGSTDLVLGGAFYQSSRKSEFRDFVDNNDLPIEQTTTFRRVPLTASLRQYITPRGRSIGKFAWIPNRYAPFVDAGIGTMRYDFKQTGDFVDFDSQNLDVFSTTFSSSEWTMSGHVGAGLDVSLSTRTALTGMAKYTMAKADMSSSFTGFDRIDLSGFTLTAGLAVRF